MLRARIAGDPARQIPFELQFVSDEEGIQAVYVDDDISEWRYVIVSRDQADKACRLIKEKIDIWSDAELFEAWEQASTDGERIDAIVRIGVAAPWTDGSLVHDDNHAGAEVPETSEVRVLPRLRASLMAWPSGLLGMLSSFSTTPRRSYPRYRRGFFFCARSQSARQAGTSIRASAAPPQRVGR
jgi:hypothetical protein